ncbi:MAG: aldehyde ferredoxin oxidoreductase family protein [Deltaproteobacteria bacterium]|nr:aldehyde ferredoxin oxidoreductase family protein [Deltaproteobacteria bacterium]
MLKGYTNRVAYVDLTTGNISYEQIDENNARKYIGGAGLAARILWDETTRETDALSPESPLILITGPLTGTVVPSSCKYILAGISPLTNIWGNAHAGGSIADHLRHAGFDGIVVKGQASRPVYIWIHDQEAEIRDASHLWGKDTYDTTDIIRGETNKKAGVATIGLAGERLARIAGVFNDGREGKAAARCGLGALMGSKKLKAIAAVGTLPISVFDVKKLKDVVQTMLLKHPPRKLEKAPIEHDEESRVYQFFGLGRVPVKNRSEGIFDPGKIYCKPKSAAKTRYCNRCPYGCGHNYLTESGERVFAWEAWGPLGTNCMIANPEALQQAFSLCQRYGIDVISTGSTIAFAMECFEKGLITKNDTDGVELNWGNHEAMIEMVRKIGEREGFGKLLGEGVRRAAERIGGIASEYALQMKGLEFPAHDPRISPTWSLRYATGSIGAAHMEPLQAEELEGIGILPGPCPELGYPSLLDRFEEKGKGIVVAKGQNLGALLDSLTICIFLWQTAGVRQPAIYLDLLNSATGLDMHVDEFLLAGERIFNLKRMFNVRRGISRKDDILPARFLTSRLEGGTQGYIPNLGLMLNEYYSFRGWSEEGIPTRECLSKLGLEECLPRVLI